jgi:hypothetical protein
VPFDFSVGEATLFINKGGTFSRSQYPEIPFGVNQEVYHVAHLLAGLPAQESLCFGRISA